MANNSDKSVGLRQMGLLTGIPALLVAGPLVGFWFGRFLDGRWGTEPYLMILFIVLGFVASGRETWKLIKLASQSADGNKK